MRNSLLRRCGVSILAGLVVVGATLLLAFAFRGREQHHIRHMSRLVAEVVKADVEADLETRFLGPMRDADLWNITPQTTRTAWQARARIFLQEHPDMNAVEWVGAGHARWSVPEAWATVLADETRKDLQSAAPLAVAGARAPRFARHSVIVNNAAVRPVIVPVYRDGKLQGIGMAGIPERAALDSLLGDVSRLGYDITLSDDGREIYRLPGMADRYSQEWGDDAAIESPGLGWTVHIAPTLDLIAEMRTDLPQFILGMGLALSLFVSLTTQFAQSLKIKNELLRDAEKQLRALIESSPAAIVTLDSSGNVLLANEAAQRLFCPGEASLAGRSISSYLPPLYAAVRTDSSHVFRTTLQCKGQRSNGEAFLAGVWFSRYPITSGQQLAAIVVDLSEDRRNWEELSFDYLLKGTRILMSAMSHEIRNLCAAALVIHNNLRSVHALEGNEDFHALGTLIEGLEKISELELHPVSEATGAAVGLLAVFDELRALIEPMCREDNMEVHFHTDSDLPLVWADHYGLLQVFLNLAKNSHRAMLDSDRKFLQVSASIEKSSVVVRFQDSGCGIQHPENLFRPFQQGAQSSGLGLYVSRAILKSYGAEIVHEPRPHGCCFAVSLALAPASEEMTHA